MSGHKDKPKKHADAYGDEEGGGKPSSRRACSPDIGIYHENKDDSKPPAVNHGTSKSICRPRGPDSGLPGVVQKSKPSTRAIPPLKGCTADGDVAAPAVNKTTSGKEGVSTSTNTNELGAYVPAVAPVLGTTERESRNVIEPTEYVDPPQPPPSTSSVSEDINMAEVVLAAPLPESHTPAATSPPSLAPKGWRSRTRIVRSTIALAVIIIVGAAVATTGGGDSVSSSPRSPAPRLPVPTPFPTPRPTSAESSCYNARSITEYGSIRYGSTVNVDPAPRSLPSTCSPYNDSGSAWFTITGNGNRYVASTCLTGTDFDTRLSVFRGSCRSLSCVDSNDDGGGSCGWSSQVSWSSSSGTRYYILVHGYDSSAEGSFELQVT